MTTPAAPPSAPPPHPGGEGAELLAVAWRHGSFLAKVLGIAAVVLTTWLALTNRVERVESSANATNARVTQLGEAMRDDSARTEARLRELDRSREEHAKALVRLESRLDAMEKVLDRVDQRTGLILDRLGDTSPRRTGGVSQHTP